MKKLLTRTFIGILVIVLILVAYVQFSWNKDFDAPIPDINASTDSAMIERGRHLVYGPSHCAQCHVPIKDLARVEAGEEIPLIGGWELVIPPGTFRAPNITPDETGIGKMTDGEIARAIRYSVNHKGKLVLPVMPYQNMSDHDLACVISYLRSQPAVKNEVPASEFSFLGKALMAFGVVKPLQPQGDVPQNVAVEPTAEYGGYIANTLGACQGCHTQRDEKSGEFIGIDFAGKHIFEAQEMTNNRTFYSPNLTPDKETGIIASWTEDQFVSRFSQGRIHDGSPMPWGFYSRLDTTERVALYRYLHSLDPVSNHIEKVVYDEGETLPQY